MKKRTYYNEKGKYQKIGNQISELMPYGGYTDNEFMNLFIAASEIYFNMYNKDEYTLSTNFNSKIKINDYYKNNIEKYILPYNEYIKKRGINFDIEEEKLIKSLKDNEKLEHFMDNVLFFVKDKNLDYTKFKIFYNYNKNQISRIKKENFEEIYYGNLEILENEVEDKINNKGYNLV